MERAASTDLLDRIRNELGPWREHSAIKRVIVVDDDQAPDGVRIVFEVSAWPAARCQLPTAMWIGALGGRRVPIEHTAIQDDPPCHAMPVRVTEQRRRSGSLLSPSSPETSSSSPAASPSVSRSSSSSSSSSPTCSLPSLPSSPVWAPSLSRRSSTDLPSTLDVKMEPTKQPDGGLDVPEHHGDAAI